MVLLKQIIRFFLKITAKLVILRHKPIIIGITGSVGKTSAKDAVKKVLEGEFSIYGAEKSMNTDFGIPLTILRTDAPKNLFNIAAWLNIFIKGVFQIFIRNYPKVLVLEMGVDRPGDMDFSISIAKPDIAVLTGVAPSHLEVFENEKEILEEKAKIFLKSPNAKIVLNCDFKEIRGIPTGINRQIIRYGINDAGYDIYGTNLNNFLSGLEFDIVFKNKKYHIKTKLFGKHSAYSLLTAFSVGILIGISPEKILPKFENYSGANGRMNILTGEKGAVIIDDSYNASPKAMIKAIEAVSEFKGKRRLVFVLGSMNELGEQSEKFHREIGKTAAKIADFLITIGKNAKDYLADEALKSGMNKNNVHSFDNPFSAGDYLKPIVKNNDLILVKGSQNGVFSEEAIKPILSRELDPQKVLVRQGEEWTAKKQEMLKH